LTISIGKSVLALAGMLAASGASLSETPGNVAKNWGLLGVWRLDCAGTRSGSDPDYRYVVRNQTLFEDRDFGDHHDSSAIVSATNTADGGIALVIRFDVLSMTRERKMIRMDDGRIRTVMSRNVATNEYSVRDGKFVSNGNATPSQTHCR
jgi:hypothetical protein